MIRPPTGCLPPPDSREGVTIRPLDVVLLSNPRSGRGRAARLVRELAGFVAGEGHRVTVLDLALRTGTEEAERRVTDFDAERFKGADALVVAGGDGTLHHLAELAIRTETPLYHVPTGNENLFAREWRMDRSVRTLLRALAKNEVVRADAGVANGHTFLLMCSLGPDASVVRRLARVRTRAIGHLAYVAPTIAELAAPHFPPLTIAVDGRTVVEGERGLAIVGNCREYALRINPCRRARMDDGLLDLAFLPCRTIGRALSWLAGCRFATNLRDPDALYVTGRRIEVRSAEPAWYQVDGEAPFWASEHGLGGPEGEPLLELSVRAGVLPVLRP